MIRTTAGALALSCMLMSGAANAQSIPREIAINVGFGAGGVYHTMAMTLSRHMGRYLPGQPTIVVRTMPGAGSLLAANHIANVAPRDGSVLAVIGGGTVLEPLFGNAEAKFDPTKLSWIGSTATETYTCVFWGETNATRIEDAIERQLVVGSTGRGSRTHTYPAALNELLGTKFKVVAGYRGMTDIHLGIERRELDGVCGWGYSSIPSQKPDWLKDNKINITLQFARAKHPELPKVPLIMDVLKSEQDKAAMQLLLLDSFVAWPLVGPPGMPAETLATYRKAYRAALADPQLLAEAKQLQLVIEPVTGEEIETFVKEVAASPPAVVQRARTLSGM